MCDVGGGGGGGGARKDQQAMKSNRRKWGGECDALGAEVGGDDARGTRAQLDSRSGPGQRAQFRRGGVGARQHSDAVGHLGQLCFELFFDGLHFHHGGVGLPPPLQEHAAVCGRQARERRTRDGEERNHQSLRWRGLGLVEMRNSKARAGFGRVRQ